MKRLLQFATIMAVLLGSCCAMAETPSLDNAEWQSFFEQDKLSTVPKGDPTGKGAVKIWGNEKNPKAQDDLQVMAPYDMTKDSNIVLSKFAVQYGLVYASDHIKNFLDATLEELRGLTDQDKLPVFSIYTQEQPIPMLPKDERVMAVSLGIFRLDGEKSVADPDVYLDGEGFQDSESPDTPMNHITKNAYYYQHYMDYLTGNSKGKSAQSAKGKSAGSIRGELLQKTESDWKRDLNRANTMAVANMRTADRANAEHNNQAYFAENLRANDNKRLLESQQNQPVSYLGCSCDLTIPIDDRMNWLMIESAFRQNVAEILEIHLPQSWKNALIDYAKRMQRPSQIIELFERLAVDQQTGYGGIEIVLACSVRDRFLGCPLGGSKNLENTISQKSDILLETLEIAQTTAEKLKLLQWVVNANPVYVETKVDLDELKREVQQQKKDAQREANLMLLSSFEQIPVKVGKKYYIQGVELTNSIERGSLPYKLDRPFEPYRKAIRPRDLCIDLPF